MGERRRIVNIYIQSNLRVPVSCILLISLNLSSYCYNCFFLLAGASVSPSYGSTHSGVYCGR